MKNIFKTLLVAAIVFLAACNTSGNKGNNANQTVKDTTKTEEISTPDIDVFTDEITTLQDDLAEKGFVCAEAYIGTILDGKTELEYIDDSEYKDQYPFMTQIGEDRTVRNEGDEVYCIVPASGYDNITVNSFVVDESNDYYGAADKELYSANDGKPILVRGNISEIMPNIIVTLSNSETSFSFNPSLRMNDGSLNRYNIKDKVQDITIYDPSFVFDEEYDA